MITLETSIHEAFRGGEMMLYCNTLKIRFFHAFLCKIKGHTY